MRADPRVEQAEKLLRTAEDLLRLARRDLREGARDERLPAALWRAVDAAVLVAQLAPDADTGLRTFTGRGGRLELQQVDENPSVGTPACNRRTCNQGDHAGDCRRCIEVPRG